MHSIGDSTLSQGTNATSVKALGTMVTGALGFGAGFYVSQEGINMLARQGLEVPDEAKEATKAHAAVQEGPDVPRAIGGSTLPCPTYP